MFVVIRLQIPECRNIFLLILIEQNYNTTLMKKLLNICLSITLAFSTFQSTQAQRVYTALNSNQNKGNLKEDMFHKTKASYSTKDSVLAEQQYKHAVALLTSIYPSSDKQKNGINILTSLLEKGNSEAGMFLANAYFKGIGVDKDEEKAIKIIEKLAAKQHPEALYKIGIFYSEGGYEGYTENKTKATEFFKKAAAKGYNSAYTAVGQMAEENKNYNEAVQWYKKGMQGNDLKSMTRLANIYKSGKGMQQPNYDEAARIYHLILSSPEYEHSKFYSAYENFYNIGNKVNTVTVAILKPVVKNILHAASNNFKEMKGEEFKPIVWEKNLLENTTNQFVTYYRSNYNTVFKNAMVVKKLTPSDKNGISTFDSSFSYQADIVYYASPAKTKEVFTKWVALLKQIEPTATSLVDRENSDNPYFTMPVVNELGQKFKLELEVVGPKSDRVVLRLLE